MSQLYAVISHAGLSRTATVPLESVSAWVQKGWTLVSSDVPVNTFSSEDSDVASFINNSTSQTSTALRAAYARKWQPNTAYTSGDIVLNPSGQIVQANSSFTSGTTYNASNWTVLSSGGGGFTAGGDLTGTATSQTVSKIGGVSILLSDTRPGSPATGLVRIGLAATASPTVPGAPTGLSATAGNGQAALSWTAPASNGGAAITDYVVQYRTTAGPGSWTTFTHTAQTTTTITVTGLTTGTGYDFQVAAVNSVGTGTYSSTASATPTGGVTTLAQDTFTRADSSGLGTSSGGQTWAAQGGSRFDVASNQAKIGAYGAVGNMAGGATVIECSNANVTVSVDLPTIATGPGLILRYVDTSNFYYVTPTLIGKYVAGSATPLNTHSTAFASGDTMSVVLSGSSIIVKKNGTAVSTITDSALSGTKHGLALAATGSVADRWDNFLVTTP